MSVLVQKFGGSSMADAERIARVADRVVAARAAGHDVVVVVSAMGRTTSDLLAMADGMCDERCDRERDMLVTAGERIAMALLCIALQARGCASISFTGSQAGILTNDRHQDARIIEVRPVRVEDELARGRVVVVAGYQGMSYKREITTLGRGGSDTTALALAAALGAEAAEIYSDVDGVYTADPRRVPDAVRLDEIDVGAMAALARGGARVLAADAVEFARRAGIVVYCRAADPRHGDGQSVVRRFAPRDESAPRMVAVAASDTPLAMLRCGPHAFDRVLGALDGAGLRARPAAVIGAEAAAVLGPDAAAAARVVDGLRWVGEVGLLTVAGQGLDRSPRALLGLRECLRRSGIAPEMVGAEPDALLAVVPAPALDEALRAAHTLVRAPG